MLSYFVNVHLHKYFFLYRPRWTEDLIFLLAKSPNSKHRYSFLLHTALNLFVAFFICSNVFEKKMLGIMTSFSFSLFLFLLHHLLLPFLLKDHWRPFLRLPTAIHFAVPQIRHM